MSRNSSDGAAFGTLTIPGESYIIKENKAVA